MSTPFAQPLQVRSLVMAVAAVLLGCGAGSMPVPPRPSRLRAVIVDEAGVLGPDRARVQAALDALRTAHGTDLHVTYTRSFHGVDPQDWAHQALEDAGLGPHGEAAAVLLAVAVDDRSAGVAVTKLGGVPVPWRTFSQLVDEGVKARVADGHYVDAAVSFADGLRTGEVASKAWPPRHLSITIVLVLVLVVLLASYMIIRRERRQRI